MNPYEELGVDQDATETKIRAAYRKRARKTHPDAGGSEEQFERTARALAILTNPTSRKRYDETGEAREEPIDNTRSQALQIIEQLLNHAMTAYASSGFSPSLDPRNKDMIEYMVCQLRESIAKAKDDIAKVRDQQKFIMDMKKRFKLNEDGDPSDPICRSLDNQARSIDAAIEAGQTNIVGMNAAIDILDGYDFKHDPVAKSAQFGTLWAGTSA